MTVYSVIAYRENGYDSCRGCVMERWDSDFQTCITIDFDEAATFIAQIRDKSLINPDRAGSYDFQVLIDGRDRDQCLGYTDAEYDDGLCAADEKFVRDLNAEVDRLLATFKAERKRVADEAAAEKAKQAELARQQAKLVKEQKEREEYERLRAKFE